MKKVINITLAGMVFAVEEDAYNTLSEYLEKIKNSLNDSCDVEEVKQDIETAIAEKIISRNKNKKMAVTIEEVKDIMKELGDPSDFGDGVDADIPSGNEDEKKDKEDVAKRLYRDTENGLISGVCAGLAQYFNIDPVIVRIIFIVLAIFNGFGLVVYLILWLIVPAAKTTEEKFAMRGESVTLKEIADRVKKNVKSVDTKQVRTGTVKVWFATRPVFSKITNIVGVCIKWLLVFGRYLLGTALLVAAAFGIVLVTMLSSVLWVSDRAWSNPEIQSAVTLIFSDMSGYVFFVSLVFVLLIPFLVVLVSGISLIAKHNYFTVKKSLALFVVWLIALATAGSIGAIYVTDVITSIQAQGILESAKERRIYFGWDESHTQAQLFLETEGENAGTHLIYPIDN